MAVDRQVISVSEAAKLLGISRNLAYAGIARGEIPSFKIGKRILIPRIALEKMLGGQTQPTPLDNKPG